MSYVDIIFFFFYLNKVILFPVWISEVGPSSVSNDDDDEEKSAHAAALMINTCESSQYLAQLNTADTKKSAIEVKKNDPLW